MPKITKEIMGKYLMIAVAVAILACLPGPSIAQTPNPNSANAWYSRCAPESTLRAQCYYLLSGMIQGAVAQAAISKTPLILCTPGEMTNEQAADVVYRYLGDHPQLRHYDLSLLAFAALMQAFPCKK